MSREDIILKIANLGLEQEKELMKEDIFYFQNKKNKLKESDFTYDEKQLKEYEIDNILTKVLASRFSTIYEYTDTEDFEDIVSEGLFRGKWLYKETLKQLGKKEDLDILSTCIIESITGLYGEYISDYINTTFEYDKVLVKDIEITKKFRDAKNFIDRTSDVEMNDFELVQLITNSNNEEAFNNYKLLAKLSIISPEKEKENYPKNLIKK